MLKCDLKLDSSSKTAIIAGVGRNVWEKSVFGGLFEIFLNSMSFYPKRVMIHANSS